MSAAVIAMCIILLRRVDGRRVSGKSLWLIPQVTCRTRGRARSRAEESENMRVGARRDATRTARPRRAMNDLHSKNAFRRSNAQVKRPWRPCRLVDSFALSILSDVALHWHVRCSLTTWQNEKENNVMKLPA